MAASVGPPGCSPCPLPTRHLASQRPLGKPQGTSQNIREQLPTSAAAGRGVPGASGCGRRGRGSALACLLPSPSGKLRPGGWSQLPGVQSVRARPVPGPCCRPDSVRVSTTRAARSPWRAGRGAVSERALCRRTRGEPDSANSPRKLWSPSLPSLLTSETHLPAGPAAAPSHPVHLAHTPLHSLPQPLALPRPWLQPPRRALPPAPAAPSRLAARPASAPRPPRVLASGSPSPGRNPPARRGAEAGVASAQRPERGGARRGMQRRGAEGALAHCSL